MASAGSDCNVFLQGNFACPDGVNKMYFFAATGSDCYTMCLKTSWKEYLRMIL